ncbi:MAG: ATP-binding protein [Muribaculaceae bacterium]|nr:ATP-binding protein [Muribaculaceae bacterium]
MTERVKYPIGQQDFKTLRELGYIYVDKTRFIEPILNGGQYYFLARPRRFGKSLFLSVLKYFFEGEKALFKGLYAESLDWDWRSYPVLRIDLNTDRFAEPNRLNVALDDLFTEWETKYGVTYQSGEPSVRFRNIIKSAYEMTGERVVILVDEYDRPLVGNLNNDENFNHYREALSTLYSNFKSSADYIRLVFLTGVSRFSKLSIFSDLNNLKDITFSDEFADICGITENELLRDFQQGIMLLAEKNSLSYKDACLNLKRNYDGYRFAITGSEIYNPWSVLNAMNDGRIRNYWTNTGMPTVIAEALKRVDADLEQLFNTHCDIDTLTGLDLQSLDPLALLCQTGYLTIKEYDPDTSLFTLGIPNQEVATGFFRVLLPYYVKVKRGSTESIVQNIINSVLLGKPKEFMKYLETYFAGVPYDLKMDNENNFQNAFYILLSLIGIKTEAEVSTSNGRIDLLLKTPRYIYIIELKFDGSSLQALNQIKEKGYARPYLADKRKIFLIGANFSSKTRTIENPEIEEIVL